MREKLGGLWYVARLNHMFSLFLLSYFFAPCTKEFEITSYLCDQYLHNHPQVTVLTKKSLFFSVGQLPQLITQLFYKTQPSRMVSISLRKAA